MLLNYPHEEHHLDFDLYCHPVRQSFPDVEDVTIDEEGKAKMTSDDPKQPTELFLGTK